MKKNYTSVYKQTNLVAWVLPAIVFICLIISLQAYALNYARETGLFAWHFKELPVKSSLFAITPPVEVLPATLKYVEKAEKPKALPAYKRHKASIALPADTSNTALPFSLTFDGSEDGLADKAGQGTGFTMADAYSGTRLAVDGAPSSAVIGYEPAKLSITDGKLNIQTNKGIAYLDNNNQLNTLGVGLTAAGKITLETTLINPYNGTKSEQGGLWFGLNDKSFVKLAVTGNKVELRKELNDVSSSVAGLTNPDQRTTDVISGLNTQTVRLRLVVDLVAGTAEGFYSTDGVNYLSAGARYASAIRIADMSMAGKAAYAGIYTSHRNATTPVTFSFDDFSVSREILPLVTAPFRINAGGAQLTVGADTYSADTYFSPVPGEVSNTSFDLTGVEMPELYYDRRFGANLSYNIPLADGKYTVKLHMVENYHTQAGKRVFDVALEGKTVADDLDLYVAGGSQNKVLVTRIFDVDVSGEVLNIDFVASQDKAIINAIEILPIAPANTNTAPVVATALQDQSVTRGDAYSFAVPSATFADADNDQLTLTASLADGSALPAWLMFDGSTFSGTPAEAAVYTLKVSASDGKDTVSTGFTLTVAPANAPVNTAPAFADVSYTFNAEETAVAGTAIGAVAATDADQDTITYSILAGNEASTFVMDTTTGVLSLAGALDFATTPTYTLTVQAADKGTPVLSATTQVTIQVTTVTPANTAPTVVATLGNQNTTAGAAFTFAVPAATFADADNDQLTLTASLADGSALPVWLTFDGSTFSGTPAEAAVYTLKVSASDGKDTVSTGFTLTVNAAAVAGCSPLSTLPCDQLALALPLNLTFDGTEGGLADKAGKGVGFTMADAYSGTRVAADDPASSGIIGYEPSRLTIANSRLSILSNKGISIVGNNNQINALGVQLDASTGRFIIETTLINPFRGSSDEQGGLWFGLNDQTFVRLAINNNRIVLRTEANDLSPITNDLSDPSRRNTTSISGLDKKTVRLRLLVDPVANTVEGFYSVDGPAFVNIGDGYPAKGLSIAGMGLTESKVYAGVFGTHRNGTTPVTYTFDNFSIAPETGPTNQGPVVATVIENQRATVGTAYAFTVPAATFTDADNDQLTLTASLTDGSALPAWLTFDGSIFSGMPAEAATYSIKVSASDGQASTSTEFVLSVNAANAAPVVVSAPEAQTLTAGQIFSFMTGSFSDPNAGDALTYTASLSDGGELPSWLEFSPENQRFNGTAPLQPTTATVQITATDKALASVSTTFAITVEAAPPVVACSPLSTLPCEQILVQLPYMLSFDGSEDGLADKAGQGTGFTMADAYSGTRLAVDGAPSSAVIGYEPAKLSITDGKLNIQTNKGIAYLTNNNQLNTLGVGVAASGILTLETTLINPYSGAASEQGGLWFGLNDKTFVKLAVTGNKVELRKERNDLTSSLTTLANPDQRTTLVINGLNTQTVRLRLVVDLVAGTAEGFYSTDGVNYLSAGARYTSPAIEIADMSMAAKTAYAGIYATHRNASTPATFTFDEFSITSDNTSGKVLAFAPNALDFAAIQGGKVPARTTVLSASEGNPAVTLTSTSASWLILPAANLGDLTFGENNFSTALAPGIYEATVTATAEGYAPATLIVNLAISNPAVAQEIRINFQDPATVPPAGWVKDYGQPFGLKTGQNQGTGLEYGWRKRADGSLLDLSVGGSTPGNGRRRKAPADVLLATLMHMQANSISGTFNGTKTEGYWEAKVPNGVYDVTLSAGDGDVGTDPEIHNLNVEGVQAISGFIPGGTAGSLTRFKTATVRVTVADGFLTINADGGTNTKINSARIVPIDVKPYLLWSASSHSLVIEKGTSETNKTFSLELGHSGDQDAMSVSLQATYDGEAANWLSFDATHNSSEPNVTFDYTAAKALPEGNYTATITATAEGYTNATTLLQITVLAPGSNQPYVISSTPANGATNVSINTSSIAANSLYVPELPGFKGGVDNATITNATVKLLKVNGSSTSDIQGVVQGTGGGDAISFSPAFALEPNTTYKFVVTDQVKSYSGAAFLPYEALFTTGNVTTGPSGPIAVEFAPKQVIPGTIGKKYTSLTFGPDGRFYALRLDGVIERFNVDRETGMLSSMVEIKSVINKYGARSSVGLTFDPSSTAENLIAWVSHCSAGLTNAPEFDGNISRLTGPDLGDEELVLTKLPRSQKDHLVNNIAFGPDGALYFCQGSNSSMGAYDGTWKRDESLLSATVLRLDLQKLAGLSLPLDVRTTANQSLINAAPTGNMTMPDGTYNPYATTSPLTIYASGVRNAYDLVWHTNGQLYVPANGSAAGGNSPASVAGTRRPDGSLYDGAFVPATTSIKVQNDWLFRVNPLKPVGYFGHPNPLRGEFVTHRGYLDNPKYAPTQGPDANYRGSAFNFELNKSPNGAIEYKSDAFGGALKGRLLVCRFSGGSDIMVLEPGSMTNDPSVGSASSDDRMYDIVGSQTGSGTNGIMGLSGFTNPLDLTEDVQTGNLYVIEYNWNNISGKTAQIVLLKATTPSAQIGVASVSPAEIIDNDVAGGTAGKDHTITIANTGSSTLTVTGIALDGTDKSQFKLTGAPSPSVSSPLTIARGSAITFNVAFDPATKGVKAANILISSTNNLVKEVSLRGLGTAGLSGANEPSLQAILDVHDIRVTVGDDDRNTNIIHSTNFKSAILGEEVAIQAFQRAVDGPVTIEPLSVFGPQHSAGVVAGFGWYTSGNANDKNELFTVANSNYQTVDVQASGTLSFDPGIASFGFYSRWPYFDNRHLFSEDALNTFAGAVPHHVRVYPLKDAEGTVVENAYIIATEEHVSGFDYQDIVVLVRNVKPVAPLMVKELTFSSESIAFTRTSGTPVAPQTVTLSANTGAPAITLMKSADSEWLVLPEKALGALTFGINEASMAPGTYSATVTASAEGYTDAILAVSLTVSNAGVPAQISVNNSELIFDGLKSAIITKRITVTNTGSQTLDLTSISISGTDAGKFSLQPVSIDGEPTGDVLAPGQQKTLQIAFAPNSQVSTFQAALQIQSNAQNTPALSIGLYGMSLNGYEGSNEPPLQQVVNTLGYNINVGWTNLAGGIQATLKGEEVAVQFFEKAGDADVMITPVARYSPNQELPFGFYTKNNGAPARKDVGTLSGVSGQHQALFPQIVAGSDQFNPGSDAFGLYVIGLENRLSYTEDQLNSGGPALHAVRTYPLKNRQGELVPNSYLVCFEDASNGDYQDYVFVLKNVVAAGTRKELTLSQSNLDFNATLNGTTPAKTVALAAANGTPVSVSLTKTNKSAWLVLPTAALGDLSFGVNTSGLAEGTYTDTVIASSSGFASAKMIISLQVSTFSTNAVKVNFQLATSVTPAGFVADAGLPYNESSGYGWVDPATMQPKDHTASMRERTNTSVEPPLRTLALMQGTSNGQTPGSWEFKVNPGRYNVTVGVGDADYFDSKHTLRAEGVVVIANFTPTAQVPTRVATATVEVTDGKLTLDAAGGTNTKITHVIIDRVDGEGDFISPVASVKLEGILESPGVYRNQVLVAVEASDAGGSGLEQVLYSINDGPFLAYASSVLINAAGDYSIRARAVDGDKNETTTSPTVFKLVKPEPSNTNMVVENLDKFPANDRLTFSLIQTPWHRTNDDGSVTPDNRNHDKVKVKISNKGTDTLTIGNLGLSNPDGWKIAQVNSVDYDAATALPVTVNPGSSVEVSIQFIAQFSSGRVRVLNDTLQIFSNDDLAPKKKIVLHGLWQARGEGSGEPYAQEIIKAFGFKTSVGFTASDGSSNRGNSIVLNTDEIMSPFFARADASKPVRVTQMAAYHGCCAATESFQWYAKGSTSNSSAFVHDPLDGQSLLPMKNRSATALAEGAFSPTGAFGFKVSSSYSDRTRNSEGKIGLRVWKAVDANGNVIPNTYIVGHDYIGNPTVTNYDYQDNVYYVSNIKPETGSVNFSELAAAPSALDFGAGQVGKNSALTMELKNLGLTYVDGSSDPVISIKKVEVVGPNLNEFIVAPLSATSLLPQGTAAATVTFRPGNTGVKNAALLVHYNNALSPLRIPLYGTAGDACSVLTAVKRIKSGADASVTINGKVWEADKSYRQGTVQLDKPAATPIAGTDDDVLYQSYLSSSADLAEIRYLIPMANGNYTVRMHFVENFFSTVGARVFNISIENQNRLSNFDIFREVGYKAAMVKDFEVSLTDGKLDLKFNPTANRLAIAGIEIFAAAANPDAVALTAKAVTGAECGVANGSITLDVPNASGTSFLYKLSASGVYQASAEFTNLAAGAYTFYAKENVAGGCETSKVFTIPDRNNLAFAVNAPALSCSAPTGSATVSNITGGSGNYTITWATTPVQTGATATGLQPGVYNVTVFDSSGCSKTQEVTVSRQEGCAVANAVRINAGGSAFTASGSRPFIADAYYGGTDRTSSIASGDILNTTDDVLYRTERSAPAFNYSIPVQNGTVNVVLHFAETWWGAPGRGKGGAGKRTFHVDVEGSRKLTNYDIYAKAGGAMKAVQETIAVTVTDGVLNINFSSGTADMPKISAIEVLPQAAAGNSAPVLASIGNKTVTVGQTLSFTATATDADAGQAKAFSLVGAPAGAAINASTGAFSWKPVTAGDYTLVVKVTDNGTPALSDEEQLTVTVSDAGASLTLTPVADAYVRSGSYAAANYGTATSLIVKGTSSGSLARTTYLRFSLSSVSNVSSARIRIYGSNVENTASINIAAYGVSNDSWTETGINWNNAPAASATALSTVGVNNQARYYELDVTAFVQAQLAGDKVVSFQVKDPANLSRSLVFNSKENALNPPQLIIETAGSTSNQAPVLASIGNRTATVGQTLSFTATATDADAGQSRIFSLANAPAGATINTSTGVFNWKPASVGDYTFTVKVTDNGAPALSDEEQLTVIVSNAGANAVRVNAGGSAFTAAGSRQFIADTYYGGTDRTSSIASGDILNTTDDVLYRTERSAPAFNYSIPVQNGTVNVVLHFAETWWGAPGRGKGGAGKRTFHVDVEGSRKLTNYDIYAKAGGAMKAIQETIPVTITDGVLNISFSSGIADMPKISAIEVIPQTSALSAATTAKMSASDASGGLVDQENGQAVLMLYPNPNPGDQVAIEMSSFGKNEKVTLVLYDVRGRAIQTKTAVANQDGVLRTDMLFNSNLSRGVYMIIATSHTIKGSAKLVVW